MTKMTKKKHFLDWPLLVWNYWFNKDTPTEIERRDKVSLKGKKLLPFAVIEINEAPVINLREVTGERNIIYFCNIQSLRFQDVVEEWGKHYSLIFPQNEEWDTFYAIWKDYLH